MSKILATVLSREDSLRISEFLKHVAPDFADNVQALIEADYGDRLVLQINFIKKNKIVRTVRIIAVRDAGGNLIKIIPAEEVAKSKDDYSKALQKVSSLTTLEDRLRILNWHHNNSPSTIVKRLIGLEVFSTIPLHEVLNANRVFNQIFYESPLTIFPYGYFDSKTGEYVITRPDTPTPWINYIGQGGYGGIISNTGGGYSFDRDPRNRRVTRYRYNSIPEDQPGHYVYLRDEDTGDFWSPTWQPVKKNLEWYECRHGPGYTRISSRYLGIRASILYFVPPNPPYKECPLELHVLRLRNESGSVKRLRIWTYEELTYWDAPMDLTNMDWGQQIVSSSYRDGIITTGVQFRPTKTFFASSIPPDGYDTNREVFIGAYNDLSRPEVVVRGFSGYSKASRGNNIASLSHFLELKPGEEKVIVYMLGITDNPSLIPKTVEYYSNIENVKKAFEELCRNWNEYLSKLTVETPDEDMNAMVNFWNPIQCRANLYWSRFVSLYDTGLSRGMGTRDSAQDTLGTVHNDPQHAQRILKMLWKLQFKDGHTWHQFFPLTGEGGPGLAAEAPEKPQWFSDDHLWLVMATCNYIRETGDFSFLEEKIPYQDDKKEETIWEHMMRAVEFTLKKRGAHGLPLLGFADWDDTMNLDHGSEKAESVWTGMLFCRVMLDLAELCKARGDSKKAKEFEKLHREMAEIINKVAWDGEWYARAYDDEGKPVGVKGEKYHWINLIPQAWAALAELGDREKALKALESAVKMLNTPLGMRLMRDPFNSKKKEEDYVDLENLRRFGGTVTYPPGLKENGGIFNHANTWAIVAAAKLGLGDLAYRLYRQILPLARRDMDTLKTEPYVYSQNVAAPEHPEYGRARNSWLTGTASWAYVAATQWILGIRPTFEGLKIAPCIPESWSGFKAKRVFRGVTYNIVVKRVGKGNKASLKVDGKAISGDVVPLPPSEVRSVNVEVSLGE
ncbi:MAG: glycosyl transferase family 36 [Candidatus Brockarchaeota archaeon]|nr:glycosyl transferase family 36 [Candidatus Brockarchaeota archaeon]